MSLLLPLNEQGKHFTKDDKEDCKHLTHKYTYNE